MIDEFYDLKSETVQTILKHKICVGVIINLVNYINHNDCGDNITTN